MTSFAFPSGGAPTGASLHLTDSLCNDGGPGAEYADCADCGPRFPPLFAHVRRDVQLGFRARRTYLRRRRPRLGFRTARADGMWDRTIVSCGDKSDSCVYMTEST